MDINLITVLFNEFCAFPFDITDISLSNSGFWLAGFSDLVFLSCRRASFPNYIFFPLVPDFLHSLCTYSFVLRLIALLFDVRYRFVTTFETVLG